MSYLIDWIFTGAVTLMGCIFLYPLSKELGSHWRKIKTSKIGGKEK